MSFNSYMNSRVQKLDWIDIGLVKLSVSIFGIIIAKLLPVVTTYDYLILIIIMIIVAIRPIYKSFKK